MTADFAVTTASGATKPILSEASVMDADVSVGSVFFTPQAQRLQRHVALIIAGFSGAALLAAWLVELTSGSVPLRNLFVLLAFASAGTPALTQVWDKIRTFRIDVDALMLLGAGLAAYVGSPFEGALLLFLFSLSGGLEAYALRRTQSAIIALRDLSPTEANVLKDGVAQRVPIRRVQIGETILIRPGEKIPLDGTVIGGASSVDEAAITGESMPRDCQPDDVVFGGTLNIDGRLEVRVTKLAGDTALAKIVELVTKARHNPAKVQRLIDRIGPTYSIVVILAAVAVAVGAAPVFHIDARESVMRGIALLIVASPCALIISTPVAYLAAIAAAARKGVLIKAGAHLEVVAGVAGVAFDKTGTLTTGQVTVTDIQCHGKLSEDDVIRLAGTVESSSTHPLAEAVVAELRRRGLSAGAVTQFKNTPGAGTSGEVDGHRVWVGKPERVDTDTDGALRTDLSAAVQELRMEGKTVSAVVVDQEVSLLAFQDTIREGALECVERLRAQGIRHVTMLTGDHSLVASKVAEHLGLDAHEAELAPEDKVAAMERIRQDMGSFMLVGDGINDAPALAHADAGIAMGSMGSDIALDAADIVLMQDRIERVAWLHRHALRTASIVRQNLTAAIAVITILSVFAVAGGIPLPIAVIGHEGSTVAVALNALRLLRSGDE